MDIPTRQAVERRFLYRASAHALSAAMKPPCYWSIEPQAVVVLPETGGRSSSRRGAFAALCGASFDAAFSQVSGEERPGGIFETIAEVTVEGLDLLGLVTVDRLAFRLRSLHSATEGGGCDPAREPSVSLQAEVENLRVLDEPVACGPLFGDLGVDGSGLAPAGARVPIEDLGDLYLGELQLTAASRRVTLLRLALRGRLEGELIAGTVETHGTGYP